MLTRREFCQASAAILLLPGCPAVSSPFYGPRPVEVPFSGNCDANGNLTINLPPIREAFWTSLKLIGQVFAPSPSGGLLGSATTPTSGGSPTWLITAGSSPIENALGSFPSTPPFVLPPTTGLQIQVLGATPKAIVRGSLRGGQFSSMEEAIGATFLSAGIVGADVSAPPDVQIWDISTPIKQGTASFAVNAGVTSTFFLNIPPNTKAIRIVPFNASNNNAFTYSIQVTSTFDGFVFWPNTANPLASGTPLYPARPLIVPIETAWAPTLNQAQLTVSVTGDPSVNLQFFVAALFDVEAVDIAAAQAPLTVQASASPAIWQAPTSTATGNGSNVNAGAALTLIPGVASQVIRLFWVNLSSNAAAAAANSWLQQDTAANRLGANSNSTQQDNNPIFNGNRQGLPLLAGNGYQVVNQQGGALAIYASVDFSQQ